MSDVARAKALCNVTVFVAGFAVGWIERALYDRLVPPGKRARTDAMHAIVRAICGLVLLTSTAMLAVTLEPVWLLALASFAVGALVGVRAQLWLDRRR